jgi:hypothetical protein
MWIVRLYLWRWSPGGRRAGFFSVNVMRVQHPPAPPLVWGLPGQFLLPEKLGATAPRTPARFGGTVALITSKAADVMAMQIKLKSRASVKTACPISLGVFGCYRASPYVQGRKCIASIDSWRNVAARLAQVSAKSHAEDHL